MNLRHDILFCILVGILASPGCNNDPGAGSPRDPSVATDSTSGKSRTAKAPEAAAPESLAKPSPEQIEKWNLPKYEPLELLTCYDGFDEPAVLCMALTPDR